ncbi:MAG: hypothetical protein WKG07_29700 [Hymenobacter sp.]
MAAVVTVTNRTPFTIVIDPVSGDNLKVRANGTLNTSIAPGRHHHPERDAWTWRGGKYHLSLYDLATPRLHPCRRGSSHQLETATPTMPTLDHHGGI